MQLLILFFTTGITLCHFFPVLPTDILSIFLITVTLLSFRFPFFRYVLAFLLGYFWTLWHIHSFLARSLPNEIEGKDITIVGHIVDLPQQLEDRWRFDFAPTQFTYQGKQYDFTGKIRLTWYNNMHELRPNQYWQFTVRLKKPHINKNFGIYDHPANLSAQYVHAIGYIRPSPPSKLLIESSHWNIDYWRHYLSQAIKRTLPRGEITQLLIALAVGNQRAISAQQYIILQHTGTVHLMAISGLHIGLIAMTGLYLFYWLFRRLRVYPTRLTLKIPVPQAAILFSALLAFIYALLAGFSVPTQRTFIMIAAAAIIMLLKRRVAISYGLFLALFLVLLWDPFSIKSQGFWLSFGAVAVLNYIFSGRPVPSIGHKNQKIFSYLSLIKNRRQFSQTVFFQLEHDYFKQSDKHSSTGSYDKFLKLNRLKFDQPLLNEVKSIFLTLFRFYLQTVIFLKNWLKTFLQAQWAITLAISPILLILFGYISLTTVIANLIAIPTVSFIVVPFVLFGTLLILPFPSLGAVLLAIASHIMETLWLLLTYLSEQFNVWELPIPPLWTLLIALIGVAILLLPRGFPGRWLGVIWLCPLFFFTYPKPQPGELWFTLLEVGQGLAVVIRTSHHTILYDTGVKMSENLDSGKQVIIPFLKTQHIEKIDYIIVSHADLDHSGGLNSIVAVIPTTHIFTSAPDKLSVPDHVIQACHAGQHWEIDGVHFEMLHPSSQLYVSKRNNRSCVLKISIGDYAILLPGDIEAIAEEQLIKSKAKQLRANVLIAPHHGSLTSSSESFIEQVQPELVLFSVGYRNQFGFPKPEVLKRYQRRHIFTLINSETGAIRFVMNKEGIFQLQLAGQIEH